MSFQPIRPAGGPLDAEIAPPGSKSLTNRALLMAALADGRTELTNPLACEDTELMIASLRSLGIRVREDNVTGAIEVTGCSGHLPASDADLFCGNSGTTLRFCAALCALGAGPYRLDGIDRMRQRPVADLVEALRAQGALVGYEAEEGYPPVIVRGGGLRGGNVVFQSPPSSQFVSAVLMASPYARSDVYMEVRDPVSVPYLTMTTRLMDRFDVSVVEAEAENALRFVVPAPQRYVGCELEIEPDASNATYFLAAPAIVGGKVRVPGLGTASLQGDVRFVDVLEAMGCTITREENALTVERAPDATVRGIDVDLNDMPDTAQTLAVVALFADGPTRIRNVSNLKHKETDRLAAVATELEKFGAEVELFDDGLAITPPKQVTPARVATYNDHRMAMSFALAGLAIDGVEILDPQCVNKTFPTFFKYFEMMVRG